MKILYVLPYVPSAIRVRSLNLIHELAKRHEVSVLAMGGSQQDLADAQALEEFCASVRTVPPRLPASLLNCAAAAAMGRPLQSAVCWTPELDRQLVSLFQDDHFDLVHVEHIRAAHLRRWIPPAMPSVFDAVDCMSLLLARTLRSSHSLLQRLLARAELARMRSFERRILSQFDHVVVTAEDDHQALHSLNPRARISIVPLGVDLHYFRPALEPPEPATLVISGKMSYHANATAALHFVKEVLPRIRPRWPGVKLAIVGSNPPSSVIALGRDPAITVTGHLPDIRVALSRATIALCPVLVKAGVQIKILEAMAMGLPVVSTAEGARGLHAHHWHDIMVANNPVEFADFVIRLLEDSALRQQIATKGRKYVEIHHRWDVSAELLESVYQQAIERRSTSLGHPLRAIAGPVPAASSAGPGSRARV